MNTSCAALVSLAGILTLIANVPRTLAGEPLSQGDRVYAQNARGYWYAGKVLRVEAETVTVDFKGNGNWPDEDFPRDRVRKSAVDLPADMIMSRHADLPPDAPRVPPTPPGPAAAESSAKPIQVVLIGAVLLGGFAWQIYLTFSKDKRLWVTNCSTCKSLPEWFKNHFPKRVVIPFFFGLAIVLGFVGYQVLRAVDGHLDVFRDGNFVPEFWMPIIKALIFAVVLTLKSYFGPLVSSVCISWSIYCYFEYDVVQMLPIMEALLDWLFSFAPAWLEIAYLIVFGLYGFGSSAYDAIASAEPPAV